MESQVNPLRSRSVVSSSGRHIKQLNIFAVIPSHRQETKLITAGNKSCACFLLRLPLMLSLLYRRRPLAPLFVQITPTCLCYIITGEVKKIRAICVRQSFFLGSITSGPLHKNVCCDLSTFVHFVQRLH